MDIQVFVFNYAHFQQAKTLFDAFSGLGYDTYLLNCESPNDPQFQATDKILKFQNIYYSGQWNEALRLATKDVMFLINSDVTVKNPAKLMARMKAHYLQHKEKSAIYAPNFWWTPWTYDPALLPVLDGEVRKVPVTDSTVWALKTSLAAKVGEVPLELNRFGWGIEIVAAYYAMLEDKYIVRDYGIKLEHPHATAYDRHDADMQFRLWVRTLKLGHGFWDYYNSRENFDFGWHGDDKPTSDKPQIPLA